MANFNVRKRPKRPSVPTERRVRGRKRPISPTTRPSPLATRLSPAENGRFRRPRGLQRRPSGASAADDRLSAPRARNSSSGLRRSGHKGFDAPPPPPLYTPQRPKAVDFTAAAKSSRFHRRSGSMAEQLSATDARPSIQTVCGTCGYRDFHLNPPKIAQKAPKFQSLHPSESPP